MTLNQIMDRDRIVEFLAGLNHEFDQVRVQILGRKKLPSINEVFAMVRSEENRRIVMPKEATIDGLALMSNKGNGPRKLGRIEQQVKPGSKNGLWCTFCRKPRNT